MLGAAQTYLPLICCQRCLNNAQSSLFQTAQPPGPERATTRPAWHLPLRGHPAPQLGEPRGQGQQQVPLTPLSLGFCFLLWEKSRCSSQSKGGWEPGHHSRR